MVCCSLKVHPFDMCYAISTVFQTKLSVQSSKNVFFPQWSLFSPVLCIALHWKKQTLQAALGYIKLQLFQFKKHNQCNLCSPMHFGNQPQRFPCSSSTSTRYVPIIFQNRPKLSHKCPMAVNILHVLWNYCIHLVINYRYGNSVRVQ